jgi:hypothetical protein
LGPQAHQRLDEKFAEVDEKTVQTQIDLAACQTAEAILTQKVRAVEAELNQSILDTLAREKNFENQLHAMEKRVPTSSQASAAKQKGGKVQVTSVGEVRTESTSLETQPETNTEGDAGTAQLEKAMLERLSALRSDLHQQSKELQETMNANRLKSDSEIEVLKNGLAEQVFQLEAPFAPSVIRNRVFKMPHSFPHPLVHAKKVASASRRCASLGARLDEREACAGGARLETSERHPNTPLARDVRDVPSTSERRARVALATLFGWTRGWEN